MHLRACQASGIGRQGRFGTVRWCLRPHSAASPCGAPVRNAPAEAPPSVWIARETRRTAGTRWLEGACASASPVAFPSALRGGRSSYRVQRTRPGSRAPAPSLLDRHRTVDAKPLAGHDLATHPGDDFDSFPLRGWAHAEDGAPSPAAPASCDSQYPIQGSQRGSSTIPSPPSGGCRTNPLPGSGDG